MGGVGDNFPIFQILVPLHLVIGGDRWAVAEKGWWEEIGGRPLADEGESRRLQGVSNSKLKTQN